MSAQGLEVRWVFILLFLAVSIDLLYKNKQTNIKRYIHTCIHTYIHKILAPLKFMLSNILVTYDSHNYFLIHENFNILLDVFSLSLYPL